MVFGEGSKCTLRMPRILWLRMVFGEAASQLPPLREMAPMFTRLLGHVPPESDTELDSLGGDIDAPSTSDPCNHASHTSYLHEHALCHVGGAAMSTEEKICFAIERSKRRRTTRPVTYA